MERTNITVDALVDADIKKTWEYYNNPAHITQWNFATDDWCCPRSENDLRVGGKLISRMEAKDGSFGFDLVAIYDEVVPYRKIRSHLEDGREVIVDWTDKGNQTMISIQFEAEEMNPADMQRNGWQAILNNFKKYTERH